MITNKELNAVKLSPTKKDFYQIWNELLDTAGKISERWDPSSTNESDPGIVLLKVLTAVADKLNYNIDANTLEAFMPSAAQEDSMRKLTEMLGYNMKYYQSATTEIKISYNKNVESPISGILTIDKFTNIKDVDDSINYVTLEPLNLTSNIPFGNVNCMEGELVECETADNNIVSIHHLDDNKRYFLPETQVAENSIFITNIENNIEGTEWRKVANLNAQSLKSKIFKFGFDSQEGLPYIQFPEDISTLIEDGLRIKYIRTRGGDGNVSKDTLTKLTTPLSWTTLGTETKQPYHDVNNFTVTNIRASTNGADKEGLNAAYNNFKKTVGTFDTLITCRDYMNKIYQLVSNTDNTTPLVSNVIVSDIKSDINRAVTLGTFTSRGIEYKVKAKPGKDFTNFDLMLYPFKSTYGLNSVSEFNKSFKYDNSNYAEIIADLEDTKTLAHNFVSPDPEELACVKNYYRLRAKINTVRKVGTIEQASILTNIYKKLFETFNMRQLDFGEEIPYDTLLNVIETADPRIKNISLDEPTLTTKFMSADNKETDLSTEAGKKLYNSLVLNNVLAGRVPLFNYNNDFSTDFGEKAYSRGSYASTYPLTDKDNAAIHKIVSEFEIPVEAISEKSLTLTDNEVIQFKAPSLKTTVTYPAYVNYYFIRNVNGIPVTKAIPATMQTLGDFLKGGPGATSSIAEEAIEYYINNTAFPTNLIVNLEINSDIRNDQVKFKARFDEIVSTNCAIFTKSGTKYEYVPNSNEGWNLISANKSTVFYTLAFDKSGSSSTGVGAWNTWLVNLTQVRVDHTDTDKSATSITLDFSKGENIKGFYKTSGGNLQGNVGYLIDQSGIQFKLVETPKDIPEVPFNYYYVPRFWNSNNEPTSETGSRDAKDWHTKNGLGQNAEPFELTANAEYELRTNEYLLINWTQSKENNSEEKEEHWKPYGKGTIIKPNFALADSAAWSEAGHSYTKLNVASKFDAAPQLLGMFTLGTNEQIEIRELVQVKLNNANTNLYWERSDTTSTTGGYVEFEFDEELTCFTDDTYTTISTVPTNYKKYMAYTLKEGEYLYYTDMNKSDIAFYGFGSTIRRGPGTPTIFKYTSDDIINTTEISANGINAAIPWRNYNLSGKDAELVITENQFINLTAGDTLEKVHWMGKDSGVKNDIINNEYGNIGVNGASWKFAGSDSVTNLPVLKLADDRYKWQIRSKLNLAIGPNKTQTLQTKNITVNSTTVQVKDKLTLYNTLYDLGTGTDTELVTLSAESPDYPLSIKANKFIQSSVVTTDVTDKKMDAEGNLEEIIANLRLKIFEVETVKNNMGQILNFGNYGDGSFTTINFEEQLNQTYASKESPIDFNLNMLIPENNFGLIMCHYQNLNTSPNAQNSHPKLTANAAVLSFFNESNTPEKTLTLRPGINVIKVDSHSTINLSTTTYTDVDTDDIDNDSNTTETVTLANNKVILTFSMLDLIPVNDSINPKLEYQKISAATAYGQILADIKAVDTEKEFYYNMPISQNLDIDMNPNDTTDTLANPLNWFNYNNINNKFVIAEIDTERLTDDIVIAKSSRSNF